MRRKEQIRTVLEYIHFLGRGEMFIQYDFTVSVVWYMLLMHEIKKKKNRTERDM